MFKLFDNRETPTLGSLKPSQHRQLVTVSESIYKTLTDYYQFSSYRLPNDHLLVQIVKNLEYSLETPFEKVVETVYARAPYVANHFNLTSSLQKGTPKKNVFYANRNNDMVDYVFSNSLIDIDPFDEEKIWKDLSPLKVLHHTCTDFRLLPINGQNDIPWNGYSVVHIDIPLLALQYREWCLDKVMNFDSEAIYNANKFIVTNVLPKLYKSHMDYVMINLMAVKENTLSKVVHGRWLPIALPDIQKPAEAAINEIHKKLSMSRRQYMHTLESFPTIFSKNGLELLKMPFVVSTRQDNWLQMLTRLPVIETLIQLQSKPGRDVNKGFINDFKRNIDFFLNAKEYDNVYPIEKRKDMIEKLQKISNY